MRLQAESRLPKVSRLRLASYCDTRLLRAPPSLRLLLRFPELTGLLAGVRVSLLPVVTPRVALRVSARLVLLRDARLLPVFFALLLLAPLREAVVASPRVLPDLLAPSLRADWARPALRLLALLLLAERLLRPDELPERLPLARRAPPCCSESSLRKRSAMELRSRPAFPVFSRSETSDILSSAALRASLAAVVMLFR